MRNSAVDIFIQVIKKELLRQLLITIDIFKLNFLIQPDILYYIVGTVVYTY